MFLEILETHIEMWQHSVVLHRSTVLSELNVHPLVQEHHLCCLVIHTWYHLLLQGHTWSYPASYTDEYFFYFLTRHICPLWWTNLNISLITLYHFPHLSLVLWLQNWDLWYCGTPHFLFLCRCNCQHLCTVYIFSPSTSVTKVPKSGCFASVIKVLNMFTHPCLIWLMLPVSGTKECLFIVFTWFLSVLLSTGWAWIVHGLR